ncbi:MAG: hypothetical protein KAI79_18555 [Bacteroidales bacterium]|nr:hypothetical protein [Bacteroidales bacterium]
MKLSEKLIGKVLNIDYISIGYTISSDIITLSITRKDNHKYTSHSTIHISDFAFKCKKWASRIKINGIEQEMLSWVDKDYGFAELTFEDQTFGADTEQEAIILATQWIIEQRGPDD